MLHCPDECQRVVHAPLDGHATHTRVDGRANAVDKVNALAAKESQLLPFCLIVEQGNKAMKAANDSSDALETVNVVRDRASERWWPNLLSRGPPEERWGWPVGEKAAGAQPPPEQHHSLPAAGCYANCNCLRGNNCKEVPLASSRVDAPIGP